MTPNHELFRLIYQMAEKREKTFDFLPNAGTQYPFIYIGENSAQEAQNRDLFGIVNQTVHIYAKTSQRATLDDISAYLETMVKSISGKWEYHLQHTTTNKQVIPDNTDVQPLLHVVLDFAFNFTKKEKDK
ncbi:hypothetical protein [Streptococcus gordonii]|uniref:hypothetical protein n=1 Tax=Streptococcus gordonii TaxID=1302 RepID=UPI000F687628|nr:hypothetical protein [Streptococcus gordonii]RSJ46629.1 hypothetical protein D8815_08385 [Streptococcus gordonii]RSJ49706.1 hypothetical protein D8816_01080 [Streptococcus gordonii]